ncbi:stage II sporulation protein M [Agreia sp. Leaf244]|uniref:stage II sporulation protein M n=1 Tax=Agreia sp. Leaf244 TaxID=1736305 RepID=UPI000AABA976|nr:stage II sporulation protein M [Agreia sp. Leaf244]
MLRRPFEIIGANKRAYLAINLMAYGLVVAGFIVGIVFPDLSRAQAQTQQTDGTADLVTSLLSNPWLFAVVIFAVNIGRLSALTIVLPSLVVPFLGLPLFAYWSFMTGVTIAPTTDMAWVALIPHSLTVVIELQDYILLLLGVYLLGRSWLWPRTAGVTTHRRGYLRGLRMLGWLALPAVVLLVIGALYESFSLLYLVHPLSLWLL